MAEQESLAGLVKKLREKNQLSQQALATAAGLSMSLIAQIEQGQKTDLRVSTVFALARGLGVEPHDLLVKPRETGEKTKLLPKRSRGRPRKEKEE